MPPLLGVTVGKLVEACAEDLQALDSSDPFLLPVLLVSMREVVIQRNKSKRASMLAKYYERICLAIPWKFKFFPVRRHLGKKNKKTVSIHRLENGDGTGGGLLECPHNFKSCMYTCIWKAQRHVKRRQWSMPSCNIHSKTMQLSGVQFTLC